MSASAKKIKWQPLESNPESLTEYVQNLGVPKEYEFIDIYSLDPETFDFYPKPMLALIALFPLNEDSTSPLKGSKNSITDDIYFVNQTIGNACGTMAILHAILNNLDIIKLAPGPLNSFYNATKGLKSKERSEVLETSSEMAAIHEEFSELGQTQALGKDAEVNLHFVTFVERNGVLVEFDGNKDGPYSHGSCKKDELLSKASQALKKIMEDKSNTLEFSLVALVKT
ncbi:ubiquitin carboxyl-terminal hydrolase isozyme L3-like protein [Neoconidiobolus thromboides FSU 785]|nr:ubiquitin carboxyl-terminal hydrolase isozyme L3-like protein [Neoconidiobolus thromboides FSU 785]